MRAPLVAAIVGSMHRATVLQTTCAIAWLALVFAIAASAAGGHGPYREYVVAGSGAMRSSGDGGPATQAGLRSPGAVGALADGGFLVVEAGRIRRVLRSGRIATVAGEPRLGFSGDGGLATAARLDNRLNGGGVGGLAALPGGGFLFADTRNHRVRRVGADGRITTVAGNGSPWSAGDGGPATEAALRAPTDIAVAPSGGFFIADGFRVRRVWADGRITTVAGTSDLGGYAEPGVGVPAVDVWMEPRSVAVAADGDLLIADVNSAATVERVAPDGTMTAVYKLPCDEACRGEFGDARLAAGRDGSFYVTLATRVMRVDRDGRATRIAGGGYDGPFGEFFGEPPRPGTDIALDVDITGDGGLLYVGGALGWYARDPYGASLLPMGQVHFLAPPNTTRLALAIVPQTLSSLVRSQIVYRSTANVRVSVSLMRRGHRVIELTRRAHRGVNRTRIPRRVAPGRYYVRLIAKSPDGQSAGDHHEVILGGVLPDDVARAVACPSLCSLVSSDGPARAADADATDSYSIRLCRRFTARRVDCALEDIADDDSGEEEYCQVEAVTLSHSGHVYRRGYGLVDDFCPSRRRVARMFRSHPAHWDTAATRADPAVDECGCMSGRR
jgi:hypothetical protein